MLHVRRRTFLKTLGAALLGSQLPGRAHAAGTARRLVIVFSPNGTAHGHWRPTGQDTQFSFAPGSILEPLAAHKSKLFKFGAKNTKTNRKKWDALVHRVIRKQGKTQKKKGAIRAMVDSMPAQLAAVIANHGGPPSTRNIDSGACTVVQLCLHRTAVPLFGVS